MENARKLLRIVQSIARIWGTLILAFVLFFALAHVFGDAESDEVPISRKDLITLIFFPGFTILGLSMALKWEGIGGLIATLGIVGLFIIRTDLLNSPYFIIGIAPPGIFYLIYWFLSRKKDHSTI